MKHLFFTLLSLAIFLPGAFSQAPGSAELALNETKDEIRITLGGKPVLEYVKTEKPVPEGIDEVYKRSGYIHPVYSPLGQEVTGDFPLDHAHQHALFFAWTRTKYAGKQVDFWNQAKQQGRIEHRGVKAIKRQDDHVSFSVVHAFVTDQGDKEVDVLHETWTVTVHQTPTDYFLFDIESVQTCASDKPLLLEKYRYGGMALRGSGQWLKEKEDTTTQPGDLIFLTSEGKNRIDGNHTRPNWVAMSGKLDGQETSIAIFGSPNNFRAPQSVRIHPNKPYFCFAPMVTEAFEIAPGEKYISRYRYLVRSAAADPSVIEQHWLTYADRDERK